MKILITGSDGDIGKEIAIQLKKNKKYDLNLLSNKKKNKKKSNFFYQNLLNPIKIKLKPNIMRFNNNNLPFWPSSVTAVSVTSPSWPRSPAVMTKLPKSINQVASSAMGGDNRRSWSSMASTCKLRGCHGFNRLPVFSGTNRLKTTMLTTSISLS